MVTALFMGWTKPNTNIWFPIRKMTWSNGEYHTVYLKGMLLAAEINKNYQAEIEFEESKLEFSKLYKIDSDTEIHGLFKPRIPLHRSYLENIKELERLGLTNNLHIFNPFDYAARSGAYTGTSGRDLFPEVTPDESSFYHFYFTAGLFHPVNITEYITNLKLGDRLDIRNGSVYHENFRLDKSPGYISDISEHHSESITVTVEKINYDERGHGSLLCAATVNGKIYIPFSDSQYQSLVKELSVAK